jgi:hypothetical protein
MKNIFIRGAKRLADNSFIASNVDDVSCKYSATSLCTSAPTILLRSLSILFLSSAETDIMKLVLFDLFEAIS